MVLNDRRICNQGEPNKYAKPTSNQCCYGDHAEAASTGPLRPPAAVTAAVAGVATAQLLRSFGSLFCCSFSRQKKHINSRGYCELLVEDTASGILLVERTQPAFRRQQAPFHPPQTLKHRR